MSRSVRFLSAGSELNHNGWVRSSTKNKKTALPKIKVPHLLSPPRFPFPIPPTTAGSEPFCIDVSFDPVADALLAALCGAFWRRDGL